VRIILIAPPGAGKGTHGQRIAARYDVPRLATGDLFRAELKKGSELGQRAARYVERGDLVPDEIVVELLREPVSRMSRAGGGYVLDGFPRTLRQAQLAAAVADGGDLRADVVVALDVPRECSSTGCWPATRGAPTTPRRPSRTASTSTSARRHRCSTTTTGAPSCTASPRSARSTR
jgi:adenylate kinase family enzyme